MVSVIIPTLDAESKLERVLLMLRNQTISLEIVIIDSSSTDNTKVIAKNHNVKFIKVDKKEFNHGATRNIAARKSKGDVLVFMTQDSLPADKNSVETLTKALNDPMNAASYGRHLCHREAKPTERFSRGHNYPETFYREFLESERPGTIRDCFFSNVFAAVRRKEFEELGGFPENVIMFEDMLMAAKLMTKGYRVAYVPEAKVVHSHNLTPKQHFARYFQAGVSFGMNPWFLEYANSGREGLRFMKEQMKYLARHGEYKWIPYAVWENACKFVGYRLGLNYKKLPLSFVKRMTRL